MAKNKYNVCKEVDVKNSKVTLVEGQFDYRKVGEEYEFLLDGNKIDLEQFSEGYHSAVCDDIEKAKKGLLQALKELFQELIGINKDGFPIVSHNYIEQMQEMMEEMVDNNVWTYSRIVDSLKSFEEDIIEVRKVLEQLPEDQRKEVAVKIDDYSNLVTDLGKNQSFLTGLNDRINKSLEELGYTEQEATFGKVLVDMNDGTEKQEIPFIIRTQDFEYNEDKTEIVVKEDTQICFFDETKGNYLPIMPYKEFVDEYLDGDDMKIISLVSKNEFAKEQGNEKEIWDVNSFKNKISEITDKDSECIKGEIDNTYQLLTSQMLLNSIEFNIDTSPVENLMRKMIRNDDIDISKAIAKTNMANELLPMQETNELLPTQEEFENERE